MSDWGDLDALPEKKRSPLFWFCGGGCLLMLIATVVGVWWVGKKWSESQDPEHQWEQLETILPHDTRPEGWEMRPGFSMFGYHFYRLAGEVEGGRKVQVRIMRFPADVDEVFAGDDPDLQPWTPPGATEPLTRLTIQGQEHEVVVASDDAKVSSKDDNSSFEFGVDGPSLIVDVTPSGARYRVLMIWSSYPLEEVTPEEIQAFLASFEIGPGFADEVEEPVSEETVPPTEEDTEDE